MFLSASFTRMLAKSGFLQVKEELGKRVDFSRQAYAKIVDAILSEKSKNLQILKYIIQHYDIMYNIMYDNV